MPTYISPVIDADEQHEAFRGSLHGFCWRLERAAETVSRAARGVVPAHKTKATIAYAGSGDPGMLRAHRSARRSVLSS